MPNRGRKTANRRRTYGAKEGGKAEAPFTELPFRHGRAQTQTPVEAERKKTLI